MKIFLTGATGYIGSVLMEQLLEEGHTLHALHRPSSEKKVDFSRPGIRPFEGDLLNVSSLERAMHGCEAAYHMAACASVWAPDPTLFYDVNVTGTRNVLNTARQLGLERVVLTSSAATLPSSPDGSPVDETAEKEQFETEYARTKFLAEEEARKFSRQGLPTVIVNPPRVYGPGLLTESNAVTRLIKWYLEGKWRFLPGDGTFIGNYTFVEDVARGHRRAMEYGKPGDRYILGGENSSLNDLLQRLARVSGINRKLWRIPMPLVRALARAEQWKADYLGLAPLITPSWLENYQKNYSLDSRKAVRELNYEITPLEEGLRKTVRWLDSEILT